MKKSVNKFFNLEKELKELNINPHVGSRIICLTIDRNTGKSTSTMEFVLKEYEKYKKHFVYMRFTKESIKAFIASFNAKYENRGYVATEKGIFYVIKEWDDDKEKEVILEKHTVGLFCNLSCADTFKSAFDNDANFSISYVVFDEFNIMKEKNNTYEEFVNIIITIQRYNPNFYVFMLGNKDNQNNTFLTNWGIRFRNKVNERTVIDLPEYGVIYVEYGAGYFTGTHFNGGLGDKLASANEEMNRFVNEGGFRKLTEDNIIKYEKWIYPTAEPRYYLLVRRVKFEVGYFVDEFTGIKSMYLRNTEEINKDLKIISFGYENNFNIEGTQTADAEAIADIIRLLYSYSSRNRLYFSSYLAYNVMLLEMSLQLKYNKYLQN